MFRTGLISLALALGTLSLAPAALPQAADADAAIGPDIGAPAPDFSAIRSDGTAVGFADISGTQGAVLVFSRSLDWCPFCKKQALELRTVADEMAASGWPINLITYDPVETLAAYGDAEGINYTLLSDPGSAMIDAFGLRNREVTAGSRFDGIPHPAIIFVDSDGTIVEVLREEGYRDRPETELLPNAGARLSQ